MYGDDMDVKEILRRSIEENEKKAREYLLEERKKQFAKLSVNNGLPLLFKDKTLKNFDSNENFNGFNKACERSEEHTSELQSRFDLVCRILLEKIKNRYITYYEIS